MESKNKQAGMPSDEQITTKLRELHDELAEYRKNWGKGQRVGLPPNSKEHGYQLDGFEQGAKWVRDNFMSPPPKSEAEVEEDPKIKGMDADELRDLFKEKTGIEWENSQGEPDIDYVQWLELLVKEEQEGAHKWYKKAVEFKELSRLLSAPSKPNLTDDEIVYKAVVWVGQNVPRIGVGHREAFIAGFKEAMNCAPSKGKYSEEDMRILLDLYDPWPLNNVLDGLVWATKYLLHEKGYDGHNHEELLECTKKGISAIERINKIIESSNTNPNKK